MIKNPFFFILKKISKSEINSIFKMSKSIVANKNIAAGSKIKKEDLTIKSPGGGLEPYKIRQLIGKIVKKEIFKEEKVLIKNIKNV